MVKPLHACACRYSVISCGVNCRRGRRPGVLDSMLPHRVAHADLMFKHPSQWLPWTFRQTLQALDTD